MEAAGFPEDLGVQSTAVLVAWCDCEESCVYPLVWVSTFVWSSSIPGRCQSPALGHMRRRSPRCSEKVPWPVLLLLSSLAAGHGSGCRLEEARRRLCSGYWWDKDILAPGFRAILSFDWGPTYNTWYLHIYLVLALELLGYALHENRTIEVGTGGAILFKSQGKRTFKECESADASWASVWAKNECWSQLSTGKSMLPSSWSAFDMDYSYLS